MKHHRPLPLFPQAGHLNRRLPDWLNQKLKHAPCKQASDEYRLMQSFLSLYLGSTDTFNAYRRDCERLAQWAWFYEGKALQKLTAQDMHRYFNFIQKPPKNWVSAHHWPRQKASSDSEDWQPHTKWRPFVSGTHKTQRLLNPKQNASYQMQPATVRATFAVLGSFFSYLLQQQVIHANPVAQIRQKKQLIQSSQKRRITRKLSDTQWQWVLNCTLDQADSKSYYERHLFIISAFYLLGLRISELAETPGRIPKMGDFSPDQNGRWWFSTISKGNKYRDIAVPDAMLDALRRYRSHLQLSPLPLRDEQTALVPKVRGYGGISTRQIRKLVQDCFNWAIAAFTQAGRDNDAIDLTAATVHWLRHTSISHDVQFRPREHVRDDAGHENTSITDLYIETDRIARHESARQKALCPLNSNETSKEQIIDDTD